MTDYADWNDTHFDLNPAELDEGFDWYEMPGDDGWSERYDYPDEEFIGGEDAYLDSYWESQFDMDFEPPF